MTGPRLVARLEDVTRYVVPRHPAPCDLDLAGTELPPLDTDRLAQVLADTDMAGGYPDSTPLASRLARRFRVAPDQVLVTAGSDDALDRAFRVAVEPGRTALLTEPTFEMLPRFARLAGGAVRGVPWPGARFPADAVIAACTATTGVVAIVTPNNPTGAVASAAELARVATAVPHALVVVDLAYVEFADDDPTATLLALPNVVVTRTFSKAWGLPGLRVGCALGPAPVIDAMRRTGTPYPASAAAITAASDALDTLEPMMQARVRSIRAARQRLTAALRAGGLDPLDSQADFVCTDSPRATWLRDALAGLGIAVRSLPGGRVRIVAPLDETAMRRLEGAIATAMRPEAICFDLDGVLADVSRSYRDTILATAARFGATCTADDVRRRKALGNANDDWVLTHELVRASGATVTLEEVTDTFEAIYQGGDGMPGLRRTETLIPTREWLAALAARLPLAIVTGRPRADAERFLAEQQVADCFGAVICREDAPLKPDPAPVRLALDTLGVRRAWMIGDTPDDLRAARAAGVVPIAIPAPGDTGAATRHALTVGGASLVLSSLEELDACLP